MASTDKSESNGDVESCILRDTAANAGGDTIWIQYTLSEYGQCDTRDEKDDEASRAYLKPFLVVEPESFDEIQTFMPRYPKSGRSIQYIVPIAI